MAYEILFFIGRILFGLFHVYGGIGHFIKPEMMKQYAKSKKVPFPGLSVFATGMILILGGASILLGFYPLIGVSLLTVFYLGVTLMMHNFWAVPEKQKMEEFNNFRRNLALMGAALMLLSIPLPWAYSL